MAHSRDQGLVSQSGTGDRDMSEYLARESSMRDAPGTLSRPIGSAGARKGIGIPKKNPKQVQAEKDGKTPYEYLVLSVLEDDAHVHKHGGDKYGKRNWTIDEINASTYVGAMFRHYKAWAEGEDLDPDSGKPHLTHLRACCAVVMDAAKHGKLIDDRLFAEAIEPEKTGGTILDEATPISKIMYEETEKQFVKSDCMFCEEAICDTCAPVYKVAVAKPDWAVKEPDEQWVVIETLGEPSEGRIRGYGIFPSKEVAQSYGMIVRRASAQKNFCSVMRVNDVKNIRSFR